LERVPEPLELMLDAEQARAYGTADLSRINGTLLAEFQRHFSAFSGGRVLDLGCGTADISIRFARAFPEATVVGIDGSPAMLEVGRGNVSSNNLQAQIELRLGYLRDAFMQAGKAHAILANSLLHHLTEPADLWHTVHACALPGAPVMVVELIRPVDPEGAHALVEKYAGRAHPRVQEDFFNSLCAAYTVEDVQNQLREVGLTNIHVEAVSELQLKAWGIAA
jgi:ubiquinone/menaquinone biosynthesis C-methylase UbiE